jgi:hypothetical protein
MTTTSPTTPSTLPRRAVGEDGEPPGREKYPRASSVMVSRTVATISGSFHTKRCRGGVERRQVEFKGVEVGD